MTDKFILVGREPVPVADLLTWGEWFERAELRVAVTLLRGVEVSTVFLGLDHSFSGGALLLFETMAFGPPELEQLIDVVGQRRCSTWAQAEAQHEHALADVRSWKEPRMTDTTRSRDGRENTAVEPRRDGRLVPALWAIASAIVFTAKKVASMTTALEDLTAAVHAAASAEQSAATLIGGLADQIAANKNDPAAIEGLVAELRQSTSGLATAITANTTASPTPAAPAVSVTDANTAIAQAPAPAQPTPAPAASSDPAADPTAGTTTNA